MTQHILGFFPNVLMNYYQKFVDMIWKKNHKKTLFLFISGTVLAYTSTAIPSIESDNVTFSDPNEVLKPFICKE